MQKLIEFANMCMICDKNKVIVMDSKKKIGTRINADLLCCFRWRPIC